jgi:hypothetical protein
MKTALLNIIFLFTLCFAQAQRFFYVEPGSMDQTITKDLVRASQYVTKIPLMSDYIIKTEAGFAEGTNNNTTLKIIVQDSATLETIYQTNEEFCFGASKIDRRILVDMAAQTLIEKNINQIVLCTRNDHSNGQTKLFKAKKDKT